MRGLCVLKQQFSKHDRNQTEQIQKTPQDKGRTVTQSQRKVDVSYPGSKHITSLERIIRFTLSLLHTCVFHGVNVEPSKLEVFVLLNLALLLLFY